jgi:hypothetical protein
VQAGTRLGHYEILTAIGSGGMGEVWKGRDTRLRRDVAIKTLPASLAQDPDRLARLQREAELLASLNHQNIATIYGLEEHDGTRFLVLELVEGPTLEERLLRGRIPVEEALTLALQLAQALEAAHDKGVIHRDLKPANIKIAPDKRIKVLDFGIAKALATAAGDDEETRAIEPTRVGIVIGTPAYMSPEQARGEAVGVQTDIWSFGLLLFEMLTGASPFRRTTRAETVASVLGSQPDYAALPPDTPDVVRRLVQRCMERDLSRRMRHIGDVRILLEEAPVHGSSNVTVRPDVIGRRVAWASVGAGAVALLGVILWFAGPRGDRPASPVYVSVPFLEQPSSAPFGRRYLAMSADGSTIAYAGTTRLWIRRLDKNDPVSVAIGPTSSPFFSPEGDWIGVFGQTALLKVPVNGGTPVTLTAVSDRPAGGVWRSDGSIVFATTEGLYEMSANGGDRKMLAKPDRSRKESLYAWPQLLPGGQSILLTVISQEPSVPPQTVVLDLASLERKPLFTGSSATYVAGGLLVYAADSRLNAVAFERGTNRVVGKPLSIPDVDLTIEADNGAANFVVSDTGTLMFSSPVTRALRTLVWIDRQGKRDRLEVEPQSYGYAMVSPDGSRVAVERTTRRNRDIWILDLKRLTQTQLTDGPTEDMLPVWSFDGSRVFFASNRAGNFDVYSQAASGGSDARVEFAGPEFQAPSAVTPDGRQLVVLERFKDLSLLDIVRPNHLEPLLHGSFDKRLGQVSPDGRWIAYESNESGNQFEIVLRSFPNIQERREVISVGGGRYPRWGPKNSNELYYVRPDGAMMAASVRLTPTLQLGPAKKLFDWRKPNEGVSGQAFDVAPDGRFLVVTPTEPSPSGPTQVSIILNWLTSLQR